MRHYLVYTSLQTILYKTQGRQKLIRNGRYVNNWCNRSADDVCKNYFKIVDFELTVRSPCNLRQVCPEKYPYVSNIIWDIFNIQKLLQMKDWIKLLQFMRELLWQSKVIGQNHLFKTANRRKKICPIYLFYRGFSASVEARNFEELSQG